MEVEAASLELLCAVWVVRHGVAPERVAGGTAVPVVVADVVAGVRRWAVWTSWPDEWGGWPLRWTNKAAVALAAWWGCTDSVQFCLGEVEAPLRKAALRYALERCASGGRLAMMQWLVHEAGADVHAQHDAILSWTIANGHLAVVQWLVERGVDVHAMGECALRWSAYGGHLAVVQWLVQVAGADIAVGGNDALHSAAARNHPAVVRWLISPESGREWTASHLRLVLRWNAHREAVRRVLRPAIARLESLDPLLRRSKRRKK